MYYAFSDKLIVETPDETVFIDDKAESSLQNTNQAISPRLNDAQKDEKSYSSNKWGEKQHTNRKSSVTKEGISGKNIMTWTIIVFAVISICSYCVISKKNECDNLESPIIKKKQVSGNTIDTSNIVMDDSYINLGLPSGTLWSSCNLLANSVDSIGGYFNLSKKRKDIGMYIKYKVNDSQWESSKGILDQKNFQNLLLNKKGKIPNRNEWEELKELCKWEWGKIQNQAGYKITGPNNTAIFLPAGGYHNGIYEGENGSYWVGDDLDLRLCFSKNGIVVDQKLWDASDGVTMTIRLVKANSR